MDFDLVAGMAALVAADAKPEVLAVRGDVLVVRVADVVLKAHERGTDLAVLTARLRLAGDPRLSELLLPPRSAPAVVRGRVVTAWPVGTPVEQGEPETLPMEQAGRMLAALHEFRRADFAPPVPIAGAQARMERAVRELPDGPGSGVVRRAFDTLEPLPGGDTLIHGDWHLGQLVRRDGYRLIDVDDLGVGDPAWDLARPAALFAAGVLDPRSWSRLLDSYLDAGGTAVRREDPWERLEAPARALVVQMAARALTAAQRDGKPLTEAQEALMDACGRITSEHEPIPRG
ncbi:aminoglycoside phosphotransferase (APT) family kinase protein [Saccharothrix tamanrassetensis]|uniref:Aminoglycoside phosphotransferase (APT) family kinase protein n=1 Tax=Saccharothrix tamanrassetensis TaxID=1051531 RepID=A0A841CF80_9PSEU|nr:phosphotransferase [Saccharothrix tamanrassetensis]MBB5954838.1 aminoglycoside phosphotransferase (APT) family kinase protein [Saccharothrix tamanrassetensis]